MMLIFVPTGQKLQSNIMKNKELRKKCGLASGLGTTVTAILLTENRYYIINVGDTRAYEISDNVTVMTRDHSVVAREIEQGIITPEQAKNDVRRSVLLQCIGASEEVYPDMFWGYKAECGIYVVQ